MINKRLKKLLAPIAICFLALGVSISASHSGNVTLAEAAAGDLVYTMNLAAQSSAFGTSNTYAEKTGTMSSVGWKLSLGSAQSAAALWIGSNSGNKAKLVLPDSSASSYNYSYVRAAIGAAATDVYYSALVAQNSLSTIGKVSINATTAGTSASAIQFFLVSSSSTTLNYSQVTLTSGTQGTNLVSGSATTFEFATITNAYYALIFKAANDFTIRGAAISFYEGAASGATLSSIAISSEPIKKQYYAGETFDATGLVVTATYSDASTGIVTGACTFSPSPLTAGTTSITVSYSEGLFTETAPITGITVLTKTLLSISIKTSTSKTSFTLGESFSYPNLVINAIYNGGTEEKTAGFTVTGVDTRVLGQQTATITFDSMTTTYSVNVTNQSANVGSKNLTTDLFISEYIEGSGNNKAIEIYNGTGLSVDLSQYSVGLHSSAATTPGTVQSLSGTLANGDVYVIANAGANASILAVADLTSTVTYYNGDDAVSLSKNGNIIDLVGNILGVDPGTAWTGTAANSTSAATAEYTLVRTVATLSPNSTFDWTTTTWNEWDAYPADTVSYLGAHFHPSSDVTPLEQATAFANYVMTGIGNNAEGSCGTVKTQLDTEFGYMASDSKTIFNTDSSELFVNARARMAYLTSVVGGSGSPIVDNFDGIVSKDSSMMMIIIIAGIGLTAMGAYVMGGKKKEDQA